MTVNQHSLGERVNQQSVLNVYSDIRLKGSGGFARPEERDRQQALGMDIQTEPPAAIPDIWDGR